MCNNVVREEINIFRFGLLQFDHSLLLSKWLQICQATFVCRVLPSTPPPPSYARDEKRNFTRKKSKDLSSNLPSSIGLSPLKAKEKCEN
jgi:hypothetical protein